MTEASEKFTISAKPTMVARYAYIFPFFAAVLNVMINRRLCKSIVKHTNKRPLAKRMAFFVKLVAWTQYFTSKMTQSICYQYYQSPCAFAVTRNIRRSSTLCQW
jgi:hypothetical protein